MNVIPAVQPTDDRRPTFFVSPVATNMLQCRHTVRCRLGCHWRRKCAVRMPPPPTELPPRCSPALCCPAPSGTTLTCLPLLSFTTPSGSSMRLRNLSSQPSLSHSDILPPSQSGSSLNV